MPIVVDANLIAAAANREPAGTRVIDQIASWFEAGDELHAPALLYYEVVSAIRKAVWQGRLEPGLARQAIAIAEAVPLTVHPPSYLTRVLEIAEALGRRRTGRRRLHRPRRRVGWPRCNARRLARAGWRRCRFSRRGPRLRRWARPLAVGVSRPPSALLTALLAKVSVRQAGRWSWS